MPWDRARLALAVLAVDPTGLRGLWLRARACPVRDLVTDALTALPLSLRRLHCGIGDEALFGGLDLANTLAAGRPVMRPGLLDRPAALILPMAERCPPGLAARLALALDGGRHSLVALDEAADADETLPAAMADRLGLFINLDGARLPDDPDLTTPMAEVLAARQVLSHVTLPRQGLTALVATAAELGITSPRAPLLALAAARAVAALAGRSAVSADDLTRAAELVYAHRAAPAAAEAPQPPLPDEAPPPPDIGQDEAKAEPQDGIPLEILVDAVRASLPDSLLRQLAVGRADRAAKGASGTGSVKAGNRHGRPLPSRHGKPENGARLDIVATLRAAAPWQTVRRTERPDAPEGGLLLATSDFRLRRSKEMSDRVLIFAVDASGSSAVARLAEAKGAVELLLAEAYSRRDHVALLSFRGARAELILPPTRSLVQTKMRLRGLPGGGGTPLASALELALLTARRARARGMTPTIALLTDGRGNIALDGSANRERAEGDALTLARAIRAAGTPAVVIDVSNRPQPKLAELALGMAARYVALPRAGAARIAATLGAALEA